ncbi:MAG: hypothetical protein RL335_1337, partial [Bacteroidota bacterium]
MAEILEEIGQFYQSWQGKPAEEIMTLRQAGSNRMYFRIKGNNQN